MKKYIIIALVIFVVIIFGIIIFNNKKTGYYTYRKSCNTDNDCICIGTPGGVDDCGKPGQYPACVNSKCGFNNYK